MKKSLLRSFWSIAILLGLTQILILARVASADASPLLPGASSIAPRSVSISSPSASTFTSATTPSMVSGPQFVSGVNTSGLVRVNNLANLEFLLNLVVGGGEMLSVIVGGGLICYSLSHRNKKWIWGCALIWVGLSLPGLLNWLVARPGCG